MQAQHDIASSSSSSLKILPDYSVSQDVTGPDFIHPSHSSSQRRSVPTNIRGKDLFDSRLWSDPTSASVFYRFISSLREQIRNEVKRTTPTHHFIRLLRDRRKLVRCYTQNIDGLETRERLSTDLGLGKGSRARFTKKSMQRPNTLIHARPGSEFDPGCEVVQLHGELENLRCTLCQRMVPWDDLSPQSKDMLLAGTAPLCQACVAIDQNRQDRGKRGTKVGSLRPNIVLYGEEHPSADILGSIATHDLTLSPDLLLILGTSLHVHGLKTLVREFARSVHARPGGPGKVVFVNLSRPTESVWKDVIDFWVDMDCDAWVRALRRHRPDMFQVQEGLTLAVRKASNGSSPLQKSIAASSDVETERENLVSERSIQDLPPKASKPKVVVPLTPRKRQPLQDCDEGGVSRAGIRDSWTSTIQLPTLPPFDTDGLAKKNRKRLAESHTETVRMAGKRRKQMPVSIWSDVGAGA